VTFLLFSCFVPEIVLGLLFTVLLGRAEHSHDVPADLSNFPGGSKGHRRPPAMRHSDSPWVGSPPKPEQTLFSLLIWQKV
jgi:hypothetical protein